LNRKPKFCESDLNFGGTALGQLVCFELPFLRPKDSLVELSIMSYPTRRSIRKRSKLMRITGVTGEVMITAGALMGLFLAWHLVWNDTIQSQRQSESATSFAKQWQSQDKSGIEIEPREPSLKPSDEIPPVSAAPAEGEAFALLYVPRFGADYVRTIAEGVDLETVLNSNSLGVGRYSQSDQLGELGNFALAAHRTTWGASFGNINELRLGDRIYVEVAEGWHSYEFRNLEYVRASEIEVLNSFPRMNVESSDTRVITLTSCHPRFTIEERIIAYGVYEGWYPRSDGPPQEIAEIVKGGA
jgi:sortase A